MYNPLRDVGDLEMCGILSEHLSAKQKSSVTYDLSDGLVAHFQGYLNSSQKNLMADDLGFWTLGVNSRPPKEVFYQIYLLLGLWGNKSLLIGGIRTFTVYLPCWVT